MESNHLTRHIQVHTRIEEIYKLERFIEEICDEFQIYDSYYGNILASLTIMFDLTSNKVDGNGLLDFYSHKTKDKLYFSVFLYQHFLDLASLLEATEHMDIAETDTLDPKMREIMMIRMLSDEVCLVPEKEALRLTFHVAGINDILTLQRIELLEKYFQRISELHKTT